MRSISFLSILTLATLCSERAHASGFANLQDYGAGTSATSQNQNISVDPMSGLTGMFNARFDLTGAGASWVTTTTTGTFNGLPPGQMILGNPLGTTIGTGSLAPVVVGALPPGTTQVPFLSFKASAGSLTTVTLDFSGLSGGFLPAGSQIAWFDTDGGEVTTLSASTAWYSPLTFRGDISATSLTGTSEPDPVAPYVNLDISNPNSLRLLGLDPSTDFATDSPVAIVTTTQDISSLTITATSPTADYYEGFSLVLVPEPSTVALLAPIALAAFGVRRRKA